MLECWNIGHEKRKTDYPTKNVESTFFDGALQASIFWFVLVFSAKKLHQNKKIN